MDAIVTVVFCIAFRVVLEILERVANRPAANEPLCGRCTYAHIEYHVNGRRDLFCGVGFGLRKLRGVVSFCTSFTARTAVHERGPVGFVPIENLRKALPE
jgi:hypothetical protein